MMPIGDDNSGNHIRPYVNYALIAINILVFVLFQQLGQNDAFANTWSTVPREIVTGKDVVTTGRVVRDPATEAQVQIGGLRATPGSVYLTLLVSMFMHGGLAHIFGNMSFLFIFGDNIENRLGHARYLIFYLFTGVLASLAHVYATQFTGGSMLIPSLGASGAISGVLAGYLLLFPKNPVRVLLFNFVQTVPAFISIGLWFLLQIANSLGVLGASEGVAYAAHIGGFLAGLALIKPFSIGISDRLAM